METLRASRPRRRRGLGHLLATTLAPLLALSFSSAGPGYARQGQEALASVDSLLARGSYAEARKQLESWWQGTANTEATSQNLRARALFLRARLHTDPRAAQDDYLTLALAHPAAPEAPAALLALGQGLLATGELQRAASYLERLARDYPTSPLRPLALLWLARVHLAADQPNAACTSARQGGTATRDPTLVTLLKTEEAEACAAAASGRSDKPPAPAYTLQAGAFREAQGAATLATRLEKAGFHTRVVLVPGSPLRRVRIGAFQTSAEADAMARKLRAAGFQAVVTTDAASERPAP